MSKKKQRNKKEEVVIDWFEKYFLEGKQPYIWIALLGFIVYFRTLFFDWVYFDDHVLILDNLFFLKNPGNIFKTFTMEVFHILHASAAYYRPMLTISYMVDSWFSGPNPFFYHFTSILVHMVTSCLVYLLFTKMNYKKELSFFFALFFAVHPVLSQATGWIPGRNDSLLAMFFITSFIFFLDYMANKKDKYLYLHLLFFAFSMFTKESALLLPFMILLYSGFVKRKKIFKPDFYKLYVGWGSIAVVWFFLRSIALSSGGVNYTPEHILRSLVGNSPAILLYLGKVFFPINLSVLPTLQDSTLVYGVVTLIVLVVLVLLSKEKRMNYLIFGGIWFIFLLVPSFLRPDSTYVADFIEHRVYLPIIGLMIILAEVKIQDKVAISKDALRYILLTLAVVLGIYTIYHTRVFKDKMAFWINAVENSSQHPLAHKNLGAMYYLDGDYDNAEKYFLNSLELNPTEPMIYNNIGLIYMHKGDYEEAETYYKKELEINPGYDNAYFNWGLMEFAKGNKDVARDLWLETLKTNPDHVGAYTNLAVYYYEMEDQVKSNYYYNEAVKRGAQF